MSESNSGSVRPVKTPRTTITDIAALGEELSEEHLRLVVGGMRGDGPTYTYLPGCDTDAQFGT
jgi:hypothetical protein